MSCPSTAVTEAFRAHWSAVFAATVAAVRDLDIAEEATQDAYAEAVTAWKATPPDNPAAWLTTTARRRAIDRVRRDQNLRRKLPLLAWDRPGDTSPDPRIADEAEASVLDEQLRLIFLCSHPSLSARDRVALTLRLVGGLSAPDLAAVFVTSDAAMAARMTRAKKRIVLSRVPCRVPSSAELPARLLDVLDVASVLLGVGHGAPSGESVQRVALIDTAVHLLDVLRALVPADTEVIGLLAQGLFLQARASTRTNERGHPVALADQDRSKWDQVLIARADRLVIDALRARGRGPYLLLATISGALTVPSTYADIDWQEILTLHDALLEHWPTATTLLNRAVAVAESGDVAGALAQLEPLAEQLCHYRPFHVARAQLLTRLGRSAEASRAYDAALACRGSDAESALLRLRGQ